MTTPWTALPFTWTFLGTDTILVAFAVFLIFLSFGSWSGRFVRTFNGVAAPFIGTTALIFGILTGFLASDIWDRDRRATMAVGSEADDLVALVTLVSTFDLPVDPVAKAVRSYAAAVVSKEWPRMAQGERAPEAERALDNLLRTIAKPMQTPGSNAALDGALLDTALAIRTSRNTRLALSRDESAPLKWLAVMTVALLSQVSIAVVHLEKARPQILALAIHTAGLIFVIGLLIAHDVPFVPPLAVAPDPIAHVLDIVPGVAPY
jgi:hypothetical protein